MNIKRARAAAAVIGSIGVFLATSDLDDVQSNICGNLQKIAHLKRCPGFWSAPAWDTIFGVAFALLVIWAAWPLIRFLVRALSATPFLIIRLIERIMSVLRKRARIVTVAVIEQATGKAVMVDHRQAIEIIRESKFARNRHVKGTKQLSTLDRISQALIRTDFISGVDHGEAEAVRTQYNQWLSWVLDAFEEDVKAGEDLALNGAVHNTEDGKVTYSEAALRAWLDDKWESEVIGRFGRI